MTVPPALPVVTIHLLSLGRLHVLPGETLPVMMHRHMLSIYVVVLFIFIGLDSNGAARSLPIEIHGAIYIIAIFLFLAVVVLSFQAVMAFAQRRGPVSVHLSPILFVATVISVTAGDAVIHMTTEAPPDSSTRFILLVTFHYMVSEVAAAIVAHTLLPTIIGETRSMPIRTLPETDPALWATETAPSPTPAPQDGVLVVADRSIPLRGLVHLQADGNYVHLWATDRHELLPGPLSDLVSQLSPSTGKLIHRSHWVAAAAITEWQVDGREITLHLVNGQTAPVAVTRRREVRDWLDSLGLPQRERAP